MILTCFRMLLFVLFITPTLTFAQENIVLLKSTPGDVLGGGVDRAFSGTEFSFSGFVDFNGGITFQTSSNTFPAAFFNATLAGADGAPLVIGRYVNASNFGEPMRPFLNVSAFGASCGAIVASFNVLEIAVSNGQLVSFAADFEQQCAGSAAKYSGQLRLNSSVPVAGFALIKQDTAQNSFAQCVEATGPSGAQVKFNATGSRDAQGGSNLSFAWTSSTGASGSDQTFSLNLGLLPPGSTPSSVTLTATDRTNGKTYTNVRDVCVADTTPPKIEIISPKEGQFLRANGQLTLEVSITDIVDKTITRYSTSLGTQASYTLDASGRSRVRLTRPDTGEAVQMVLEVRATDAAGNLASKTVNFARVKPGAVR